MDRRHPEQPPSTGTGIGVILVVLEGRALTEESGVIPPAMIRLFNYFALFLAAVVGIVVFDDDPSAVSTQEWILFAVMVYAAVAFFRSYRELMRDSHGGG